MMMASFIATRRDDINFQFNIYRSRKLTEKSLNSLRRAVKRNINLNFKWPQGQDLRYPYHSIRTCVGRSSRVAKLG